MSELKVYRLTSNTQFVFTANAAFLAKHELKQNFVFQMNPFFKLMFA